MNEWLSKQMVYIKTDDELFRIDCEYLASKDLLTEENMIEAYLKNLVTYHYSID